MKATLETVTGVTINRDIDTADSPMGIIRKFYEEDATAATQIFSNQKAIDQLMDGHIDEAKSAFELLSIEGDSIKADWKTALCNQPAIKEEMAHIESEGPGTYLRGKCIQYCSSQVTGIPGTKLTTISSDGVRRALSEADITDM